MTKAKRLEQLEQECRSRGVKLIYDDLRSEGGLCRLRECYYLILNRRLASETRARIIADALSRVEDRTHMETAPDTGTVADIPQGTAPERGLSAEPLPESAPVADDHPIPVYEEPEVGIQVSAGVPDSQS